MDMRSYDNSVANMGLLGYYFGTQNHEYKKIFITEGIGTIKCIVEVMELEAKALS